MTQWRVFGVALLAMGCGGVQRFDAAERATATSPRGDLAAEYEIVGARGQIVGARGQIAEAKVWLRGAYEDRVDGREVTVIEVVFEVENEGDEPVTLADVRIDSARASGVDFEDLRPFSLEGDRVVEPGGEGTLRAYFAIPQRFDPEDITQLEVGWSLRHEEGTYAQRTPFQQVPEQFAGYPYVYPIYAPWPADPLVFTMPAPVETVPPG